MPNTKTEDTRSPFQKALTDPVFYEKYPVGEQRRILSAYDDNFGQLPEKEQNKVIGKYHLSFLQSPEYKKYEAQKSAGKNTPGEFFGIMGTDLLNVPMGMARLEEGIVSNPKATLKAIAAPYVEHGKQAWQSLKQGDLRGAAAHGVAMAPIIGPPAAEAGQEWDRGEYARSLAHATELLVPDLLEGAGITPKLRGLASEGLKRSAEEEYAGVLHPSPKADKFITQRKLLPGLGPQSQRPRLNPAGKSLLDRRLMAWTSQGMIDKIEGRLQDADQKLDAAYAALPPSHQIKLNPILQRIQDYAVEEATAEAGPGQLAQPGLGNRVIVNPEVYAQYQDLAMEIIDRLGAVTGDVSPASVRMLRQSFDKIVKKTFQGQAPVNISQEVYKNTVTAIRQELNSQATTVGRLNAETSFWLNAQQVMTNTVLRKVGQKKFMRAIGRQATNIAVAAMGGEKAGMLGAAIGGWASDTVMKQLQEIFDSTAWHTVKAVTKNEIAKAIASRQGNKALRIAQGAVAKGAQATLPTSRTEAAKRYKD